MEHIYDILKIAFGAVLGAVLTNWVNIKQERRQKTAPPHVVRIEQSIPDDAVIDCGEI